MANRTTEEYVIELIDRNPDVELLEDYLDSQTMTLHRCRLCNHTWRVRPNSLLRGGGCPVCAYPPKVIGPAPEYKNSIWASKYKKLAIYYGFSEALMKSIMPMSNRKLELPCPNCGQIKKVSPAEIFSQSFFCNKCSDGISYPEKFIGSWLTQLEIKYETHCTFDWSGRKQYDFYLPNYSCIIEAHGKQHYEDSRLCGPAKAQQENDIYKEMLARSNGIQYYFQVDCRESEPTWIHKSLSSSGILTMLGIADSSVDLERCAIDALSSKVKYVADLWSMGYSVKDITEKLHADRLSVRRWLKKAATANICDYNSDESWVRGHSDAWRSSNRKVAERASKPIICVETGIRYKSQCEAGRQLKIAAGNVGRSVRSDGRYAVSGLHFIEDN